MKKNQLSLLLIILACPLAVFASTDTDRKIEDAVVTLTGTADNQAQKELTAMYAKEIDWVKSVNNEITIKPKTESTIMETIDDASITTQVKYALLAHKSTSALSTKVTTNEGIVVVTGKADSAAEKSLVTKLITDVRGVKSVNNKMTIN